jgi:hypothetical protein
MSNLHIAWTIFKLKVVRVLLKPILRLHIWAELRKRGSFRPDMQGPDAYMEHMIAKAKEKKEDG